MENFVNFLSEYKELLVSALCVLLTLISVIVKRRPKTLKDLFYALDDVIASLPKIIIAVERPGDGASKKKEVINSAFDLLEKKLGRHLDGEESLYAISKISSSIESILETPQKKGVLK